MIQMPKSKFISVACKNCRNEQVIYNKAATEVKCVKCGEVIAKSTGGEIEIKAKILQILS